MLRALFISTFQISIGQLNLALMCFPGQGAAIAAVAYHQLDYLICWVTTITDRTTHCNSTLSSRLRFTFRLQGRLPAQAGPELAALRVLLVPIHCLLPLPLPITPLDQSTLALRDYQLLTTTDNYDHFTGNSASSIHWTDNFTGQPSVWNSIGASLINL